jgi:tetratricopeptide (TPR) repeat protein
VSCRKQAPTASTAGDSGNQQTASQYIAEADQLYVQREDLTKVRQGITLLRQARLTDYGNYEAAWKLAKFNYYLASHTNDEREREGAFHEGVDMGKMAVQLQDSKADGHFWLGANYGGSAEHSTLAGLANVEDIRREMEAVIKIDEGYQGGSPYLVLGQLYLQAPRMLGGDYQKAIGYLEKGLQFGGNNALIRVNLAEAYHATNRNADARKQVDLILKMTPDPNYLPEYKEAVEQAKKLDEKIQSEGKA